MRREVYLDYSATTPTDPRVVDAMMPYFNLTYGNPSSAHGFGRKAESAIESARERVATVLNCKAEEIVFTSCGSESDNLAVRGVAWAARQSGHGTHVVTSPIEHSAVLRTVQQLAEVQGFRYSVLPVDQDAMVQVDTFRELLTDETVLASVMYANNEVGTIQPIAALTGVAREQGVIFHTDAVQAAGQLSLDVQALGVDLMSLSAHKFYGPKGVGALFVREGVSILSSQTGGSHERGFRAGTHNTPLIVGLATALELAYAEQEQRIKHYQTMRDMVIEGVLSKVSDVELTGHPLERLPSHASFVFAGVNANTLIMHLDVKGIAVSSASACKVGNPEPSGVLLAMGYEPELALGSLRITVGMGTTTDDVAYAVDVVAQAVEKLRRVSVF